MSTILQKSPDSGPVNSDLFVSVVIATFNRCTMLKKAVESVFAQTYPHYELIVVDDGSTDDTKELLAGYGPRLRAICQPNRGVSAARNAGIRAASGELVALLDSDDYWLPEKLEMQTSFFKSNPSAMICQSEEIWIRMGVRVNPGKRHRKYSGYIFEKTLPLCLVSPSAVMMRKKLLQEVGLFDEQLPACEDYDLWLRISWKYPVYLLTTPLIVKHGGHEDQLSKMPQLDKYRIAALSKLIDAGCLSDRQKEAAVSMLKKKCRIYANGCLKRSRNQEAQHYIRLAQKHTQI
ncbi:MAG: glycosyltransferase family 2 protein [Desulfobacteraceae bacterium]|nr:glycosyltransferase family 2 protein [Desulfobacteraceae bacterium]